MKVAKLTIPELHEKAEAFINKQAFKSLNNDDLIFACYLACYNDIMSLINGSKVIIYYLHSFDFTNESDFETNEELDSKKIKAHPAAQQYSVDDFIHMLNVRDVDTYGLFAYEVLSENDQPINIKRKNNG